MCAARGAAKGGCSRGFSRQAACVRELGCQELVLCLCPPSCADVERRGHREVHVRTQGQKRYGITNEVATHLFADKIVTAAPGFNAGTGRHIRAQQASDWCVLPASRPGSWLPPPYAPALAPQACVLLWWLSSLESLRLLCRLEWAGTTNRSAIPCTCPRRSQLPCSLAAQEWGWGVK